MARRIIVELAERIRRLSAPSVPPSPGESLPRGARRARREILRLDAEDLRLPAPRIASVGRGGEPAVADWCERRFGARLPASGDADILVLRGPVSPHALVVLALANPGDPVIVPDPGPPALRNAVLLAGGDPVGAELGSAAAGLGGLRLLVPCGPPSGRPESARDLDDAIAASLASSRVLVADVSALLLDLTIPGARDARGGRGEDRALDTAHDARGGEAPPALPTLLSRGLGAAAGVEIVTFDLLFGAGGSPFSIVAGNAEVVAGVRRAASALGVTTGAPASRAIAASLGEIDALAVSAREALRRRRDALVPGLERLGFRTQFPSAGLSLFAQVPPGYESLSFARMLLRRAGILVRPGGDFGERGEGGFAVSLAAPDEVLFRALGRIEEMAPRMLRLRRQLVRAQRARGRGADPGR